VGPVFTLTFEKTALLEKLTSQPPLNVQEFGLRTMYPSHVVTFYEKHNFLCFLGFFLSFIACHSAFAYTCTCSRENVSTIRTACRCCHSFSDQKCVVLYGGIRHDQLIPSPSPPPLPLVLSYEREEKLFHIYTPWCTIWSDQKRRHCLLFLMIFVV
jgi:hypothetical protein